MIDTGAWTLKGIGALKVNQSPPSGTDNKARTRVVMRKEGNLEVILNSLLFKGMACEKAGDKGVTFTGAKEGGGGLVTYLVKSSEEDAEKLFAAIESNIPNEK